MTGNNTFVGSDRTGFVCISDIREKMISIRKRSGISKDKMAILCGVSGLSYSRWESGVTRSVNKEHYETLLNVLDVLENDIKE